MAGVLLVPSLNAVAQQRVWGAARGHSSSWEHNFPVGVALALASLDEVFGNFTGAHKMPSTPTEAAEAVGRACACSNCCELVLHDLGDLICDACHDDIQGVLLDGGWVWSDTGCGWLRQRLMRSQGRGCGAH
jgi:hypothetical protein